MVNGYVINVGSTASAIQWNQLAYEITLNGMGNGQMALDGIAPSLQSNYDVDEEINIYKNGNFKFRGIITEQDSLNGGGIVLSFIGIELQLADEKCPMSAATDTTRIFTSTSDNSIISTLVTSVSGWTVNVSNSTATTPDSFRVSATESVWNGVIRLIEQTGKDIWVDRENKTIYLYDELKRSNQFNFVEGLNSVDITRTKSRSKAGKVLVYGKGDGEFQIVGSFGSGTPVHTVTDRNISTIGEANTRAEKEYDRLNPNPLQYTLTPNTLIDDLRIGDSGNIQNNSASINDQVDITRIKYIVAKNGTEKTRVEVTNPEYRIASKKLQESLVKDQANYQQSQTTMQGAPGVVIWGSAINASSITSLKVGFYISDIIAQDQAGNLKISSLTCDYDIDPYSRQFGDATFTGTDPQVQNDSGGQGATVSGASGNESPGVSGTSASTQPSVSGTSALNTTDTDFDTTTSVRAGGGNSSDDLALSFITGDTDFTIITFFLNVFLKTSSNSGYNIKIENLDTGTTYLNQSGFCGGYATYAGSLIVSGDIEGDDLRMTVTDNSSSGDSYGYSGDSYGYGFSAAQTAEHDHSAGSYTAANHGHTDGTYFTDSHDHSDGSYAAASHSHPDGTYDINAADLDDFTIGDSVSDAASVNATSVDLYLDYWNGSSWVNKHSVLATGKIIDQDVDITNNGTYPDAVGFWRVRIVTNSATADLVKGIIKMKYQQEA